MVPKGKLLIIGGAEDKETEAPEMQDKEKNGERYEVLKQILPTKKDRRVEIITTGSSVQGEVKKKYSSALRKIGCKRIGFIHIRDKNEARAAKHIRRIEKAAAIF